MTSKQIMLIVASTALLAVLFPASGCMQPKRQPHAVAPYETRRVFAVAPLRNESGNRFADGIRLADKLTERLALTRGLDTLPVNRVLAAMEALGLTGIDDKGDALRLREVLGVDGLVVGSITAYDPYEPPKLGLNLELYLDGRTVWEGSGLDTRGLSASPTNPRSELPGGEAGRRQPVTAVSGFFDAADPFVLDLLHGYTAERGPDGTSEMTTRRHLISMDLYSEFVGSLVTGQLLEAERLRLRQPHRGNTRPPQDNRQTQAPPRPDPLASARPAANAP
jgi:hypothetical protein